jgi:hypothetical protein
VTDRAVRRPEDVVKGSDEDGIAEGLDPLPFVDGPLSRAFRRRLVTLEPGEAMAYVVNQDQFVESVFKGRGEPAYHLQPAQIFQGGAEGYDSHYQG